MAWRIELLEGQLLVGSTLVEGSTLSEQEAREVLRGRTWVRRQANRPLCFTATQLKNQTGIVIEAVLRGQTVLLTRHGRTIAEIRPRS